MSPASLAVAHSSHPDTARIAALSAAMAVNLAILLIASRPLAQTLFSTAESVSPVPSIHLIERKPDLPPPPPIEMAPLPPPTAPVVHQTAVPITPPVAAPSTEGNVAVPPMAAPSLLPASRAPGPAVPSAPVEASLAYRAAPLRFPTRALQQRMQGTVVLRVLVGETGKPLQVTVEHGSGYVLLDRSAVEQVLAGWQFQPAIVDGQAVQAWAKVPVTFSLRE
ncbi:MAG TPA: TonB family protein [Rhodanobacter sp.]